MRAISPQRRSQLALFMAGLLTLGILIMWLTTLGQRLSDTSSLSASNEEDAGTLNASQSIQDRLNELGASFDVLQESASILSGSGSEEGPAETPQETPFNTEESSQEGGI
jgi:hypothetical protein